MDNSAVNQPTHERISQIEMEKRLKEAGKQEQFYSIALFDILGFSNYVTSCIWWLSITLRLIKEQKHQ